MLTVTDKNSKKDEILEVASRLFYQQGFHQTGVQQIIKEAKAAKGTFYTHFQSKEDLGVAWLKARHLTWNRMFMASLESKSTAKEKILAAFEFLGTWLQESDYRGCAFLNTLCETPIHESPLRDEIREHKRELRELFLKLTAEHHKKRSISQQEQIGSTLFLLFEGTLIELQNFRESWPLDTARQQVLNML